MARPAMKEAVSASAPKAAKKGKHKVRRVSIEPAVNGGYIGNVDHEQSTGGPYMEPQQHALGDRAALQDFIDSHFGKHQPKEEKE